MRIRPRTPTPSLDQDLFAASLTNNPRPGIAHWRFARQVFVVGDVLTDEVVDDRVVGSPSNHFRVACPLAKRASSVGCIGASSCFSSDNIFWSNRLCSRTIRSRSR